MPGLLKLNHSTTDRNGPAVTEGDVVSQDAFNRVLILKDRQ